MAAGSSQPHAHAFDVAHLHMPRMDYNRRGMHDAPQAGNTIHPPSTEPSAVVGAYPHQLRTHAVSDSAVNRQADPYWHQHADNTEPQQAPGHEDRQLAETACPQVQFGVFTNIASGTAFRATEASRGAQDAMARYASEDPPEPPPPKQDIPGSPKQQGFQGPADQTQQGKHPGAAAESDSCPQVEFGVFTNLATGSHFARVAILSDDAVRRMGDFAWEYSRGHKGASGVVPEGARAAAAKPDADALAGHHCPQVKFGGFKNVESDGALAPPGKLSEKQRATEKLPTAAVEMPTAAVAHQLQPHQPQATDVQTGQAADDTVHASETSLQGKEHLILKLGIVKHRV